MAEESMDGEEIGVGGYVDDDLDLDDDLMDSDVPPTPSLGGPTRSGDPGAAGSSTAADGPAGGPPSRSSRDYTLRVAGEKERHAVVARFLTPCPDLGPPVRVRALRDAEHTPEERQEALLAEKKQHMYYNSHVGRKRRENKLKQGLTDIPDRDRKRWRIEVYNPDEGNPDADRIARSADADEEGGEEKNTVFDRNPSCTRVFEGSFEGKSSSRYAILMVNENTRTADVVPIGPYAWFSFRQTRGRKSVRKTAAFQSTENAERALLRKAQVGMKALAKYQEKAELAQEEAEFSVGSMAAVRAKKENAVIGIHRGIARRERTADAEGPREDLDFEQVFDNDDLAQVEKEETAKPADTRSIERGREMIKKFRRMIKDEQEAPAPAASSRPTSPRAPSTDSEDEGEQDPAQARSRSHSPMPSHSPKPGHGLPPKPPGAPVGTRAPSVSGAGQASGTGSRPGSSRVPTPARASPSSAPVTPMREQLAHLLPPAGTLPTDKHVIDVLSALIKARHPHPVPLKEFTKMFDSRLPAHKKNLVAIMKRSCKLVEVSPGSKSYNISLGNQNN